MTAVEDRKMLLDALTLALVALESAGETCQPENQMAGLKKLIPQYGDSEEIALSFVMATRLLTKRGRRNIATEHGFGSFLWGPPIKKTRHVSPRPY